MKILVADDEDTCRQLLADMFAELRWDVVTAADGDAAWRILETLEGRNAPDLMVLDWMMPGLDGIEICRKVRTTPGLELMYIIVLTQRVEKEDLAMALTAGANDYIAKPFHPIELESRVRVGERVLRLQRSLDTRVKELEAALAEVKHLRGMLPICSYCKKVRNEDNYWQQVEAYITSHSELELSHSVCPQCFERVMKEIDEMPS